MLIKSAAMDFNPGNMRAKTIHMMGSFVIKEIIDQLNTNWPAISGKHLSSGKFPNFFTNFQVHAQFA